MVQDSLTSRAFVLCCNKRCIHCSLPNCSQETPLFRSATCRNPSTAALISDCIVIFLPRQMFPGRTRRAQVPRNVAGLHYIKQSN